MRPMVVMSAIPPRSIASLTSRFTGSANTKRARCVPGFCNLTHMGQKIAVRTTHVNDVALFDLDRSLTGQDGIVFDSPPASGEDPPAVLARRLYGTDGGIQSVYVLSNTVSVRKSPGWDEAALEEAADIVRNLFVYYDTESPAEYYERLRLDNYNATIKSIRAQHSELWVLKIEPDEPIEPFKAGQYTTLALGYWEPRADEAMEDFDKNPEQLEKMARRSYSVASSIVNEKGDLVEPHPETVEFYIVQVTPSEDQIPALTPRIFRKRVGDRIYMSHKFTGRYTLDDVKPGDTILFLSTGTGEAPQNAMTAELLRQGHKGKIVNAVCVRYRRDLAYTEEQAMVQERYPNYTYTPLTTREPENEGNKIYIQDMIASGMLEEILGEPLDPETTHAFLCGNPAMIGLPEWDDDGTMHFPETIGVCELLSQRGFTIDYRKERGNVHYEEYW